MSTLITNVYDDTLYDKKIKSGWGFSCYIEHEGKKILFDTGSNSYKLVFNMRSMGVNIKTIDILIVSHNHWDHTGGLTTITGINKKLTIYTGSSFSAHFRKELTNDKNKCKIVKSVMPLCNNKVLIGKELGNNGLKEIALALESPKGLIIITGCAHPGIIKVVEEFQRLVSKKIYLVLGGFHLYNELVTQVKKVISEFRKLGVEKVAPCHCTGKKAIKLFQLEFKSDFIEFRAGSQIKVD